MRPPTRPTDLDAREETLLDLEFPQLLEVPRGLWSDRGRGWRSPNSIRRLGLLQTADSIPQSKDEFVSADLLRRWLPREDAALSLKIRRLKLTRRKGVGT